MADNKNQNWNQDQSRTQNPDQKNESLGSEQKTGSEMDQQDRSRQGSGDLQSGNRGSNLDEQSERSSSDTEAQDI